MSQVGSFGVNYKKIFADPATTDSGLPLPIAVGSVGSLIEGDFVFVQADGAIAQYAWVKITEAGQASEATDAIAGPVQVGVAQVAAADNEYLWVWIGGPMGGGTGKGIKGKILTGYVAGNALYTTSTAGCADDATATDKLNGVVGLANTSGTTAVELASTGHIAV